MKKPIDHRVSSLVLTGALLSLALLGGVLTHASAHGHTAHVNQDTAAR